MKEGRTPQANRNQQLPFPGRRPPYRQLRPTAYGTGSSIYANWNLDLDNADGDDNTATGQDDPWDFGTATQHPALKYGQHTAAGERVTVNLTASPRARTRAGLGRAA